MRRRPEGEPPRSPAGEARSFRRRLARAAVVLVAIYLAALAYLFLRENAMVYPGAARPTSALPATPGAVWDSVRVPDQEGVPVFVLTSTLDDGTDAPWVLFLHGNATLVDAPGSLRRYELMRQAGFNVAAVEYRGYGASTDAGPPSEAGLYADALAAWAHLTTTGGIDPRTIAVYGWSLGGGPATWLASNRPVGALLTEGTFSSLPDLASELYPWVPARALMRNRFDNLGRAPRVAVPWVVLHGTDDTDVPFAHAQALAEAAPVALLVPVQGGHNDGVLVDRETTLAALRALARNLVRGDRGGGPPSSGEGSPLPEEGSAA